jgi:RNA 3'-terminal phosphate cyclase (ATP)
MTRRTGGGRNMIRIDGSEGEGGGQVLRTALALSLATGTSFQIENIRGRRPKPGLLRQHLTAVQAATAIGCARVQGDALRSAALTFVPASVEPGDYAFAVGTAGSATLVLQTILPPLLVASGPTTLTIEGGTHNPAAPPFDFIDDVFLPVVERLGPRVNRVLARHGFYPAGGGRIAVRIEPAGKLGVLEMIERGEITGRKVRVLLANLPQHIAERELGIARDLLNWSESQGGVERVDATGPGNAVLVDIESEHARELCTAFGESGVPAEAVAHKAVQQVRRYLAAGVPVGCHLADQLLPLLALGQGGVFRTVALTQHSRTNAEVVRMFTGVSIDVTAEGRDVVRVEVKR